MERKKECHDKTGADLSEKVIYLYRFQGIILMSDDKGMREEVDEELIAGIRNDKNNVGNVIG